MGYKTVSIDYRLWILSLFFSIIFAICAENRSQAGVRNVKNPKTSSTHTLGLNLDGNLGFSTISGGTSNIAGFTYGGRVGYSSNVMWEVGLSYSSFGSSNSITLAGLTTTTENSLALVMSDFDYHLMRELHPISIGIMIGIGITSGSSSTAGGAPKPVPSVLNLGFGFRTGYDHEIGRNFTVGPEARIVIVMASTSMTVLQGLFSVKYWF